MPDIKQPNIKADVPRPRVAGLATPVAPATDGDQKAGKASSKEAPTRKVVTTKSATPAKKRVARKKPASTTAKKPAAPRKTARAAAAASATSSDSRPSLSRDERQRLINDAAYLISLKRSSGLDGPQADWLYAETVIDMAFNSKD